MSLLKQRYLLTLLGVLSAAVVWSYLPPFGRVVDLPDLVPFFAPEVPHTTPVFIHSGNHVYYRVRLKSLVSPWFARQHYEKMRRDGVQWRPYGDSPFRPLARLRGWDIGLVREKSVKPYVIEYWKVSDNYSTSFPVKLRWPWLEVRLGPDVLKPPKTAVIVPERSEASVDPRVPLPSGAVITRTSLDNDQLRIDFLHPGPRQAIARFYEEATGAKFKIPDGGEPYRLFVRSGPTLQRLATASSGLRRLSLELPLTIFADEWVSVYAVDDVSKIGPGTWNSQPAGLRQLPHVIPAYLRLMYSTPQEAAAAKQRLVHPRTEGTV